MFDTLGFMDELKRGGIDQTHAEALTKATSHAFSQMIETNDLATRHDIHQLKTEVITYMSDNMWKTIGILSTFQTVLLGVFGLLQYMSK